MNRINGQIGFSQRVRLEWLDKTANLVLAGSDKTSIYNNLRTLLRDKLSVGGNAKRGSKEKTITILMKIWVSTPNHLNSFKLDALNFLSQLSSEDRLFIHWGMTMAVYPFWGVVASYVGRLLKLQGVVSHAQVRRRIQEQYGQRPTVKDAVRRVLRSMVDWRVLTEAQSQGTKNGRGMFIQGRTKEITCLGHMAWLIEAFIYSYQSESVPFQIALNSPRLFPFKFKVISAEQLVKHSRRLEVIKHGLDQELITLCRETL